MNTQIKQAMRFVYIVSIMMSFPNVLHADCKIEISASPTLPAKNILENPGFEERNKNWSQYASSIDGKTNSNLNNELDKIIDNGSHSGKFCCRLTGNDGINNGIKQEQIKIDPPINAGTPIYMSGWLKSEGTSPDGGSLGVAVRIMYSDNQIIYIPPLCFSKGTHREWTKATNVFIPAKDVKMIYAVYCVYNNQEGAVCFDDIFIAAGKTKITYKVSGSDIKNVKLYGEEVGLIESSNILPRGINSYVNTAKVGILGTYCVEVEDYAGNTYRKIYPETEKQIPAKGIINISRMQKEIIKPGKEDIYKVFLPDDITNKKVILKLKARLHKTPKAAGYCAGMKILLNNTELQGIHLLDRKKTFTLARGSIGNTYYNGGFATYYSPDFASISEDNAFCPVDIPDQDPYLFKFDVSALVKKGMNIIIIKHNASIIKESLVIKDMKIIF